MLHRTLLLVLLAVLPLQARAQGIVPPGKYPTGGAGEWVRLATVAEDRTASWHNLATDAQGRAYSLTWNGDLWRFDPAGTPPAWTKLANVMKAGDSPHNCTLTGDGSRIWLTGLCGSAGAGSDPSFWYWDVATSTKVVHCPGSGCGSGGANSAGAYDPVNKRLLAWAGWLGDITQYDAFRTLTLDPLAAAWTATRSSPVPTPEYPVKSECDRLAHNRGGWDGKRSRAWIVMNDGALWTRDAGATAWTKRPTTGGPPNACTVFAYHAALDRIVGWTGVDTVTGANTPMVRKTWLLDPAALTWTVGPSADAGETVPPGATPTINAIAYDAVRGQVILRAGAETWAFRATGSPPPPPAAFPVTVSAAGPGAGVVTGSGSYQAGAPVALAAIPANGSAFSGWSPAPCGPAFTMPAAAVACVATFTLVSQPPPPPPPPPPAGSPRVFEAIPAPADVWASPFGTGSGPKDIMRATGRGGRLVIGTGDYAQPPQATGHNTLYEVNAATGTYVMIGPACGPAGTVSPARPTDRGILAYDSLRDGFWLRSVKDAATPGTTCAEGPPRAPTGSTYRDGLLFLDAKTGIWTQKAPGGTAVMSGGEYLPTDDAILYVDQDVTNCAIGGLKMMGLKLDTFTTVEYARTCTGPTPAYSGGSGWGGALSPQYGMLAFDRARGHAYVCGVHQRFASGAEVERAGFCFRYDVAARTLTPLPPLPPPKPGITLSALYVQPAWDPTNDALVWPIIGSDPCATVLQLVAWNRTTNAWEDIPIVSSDRGPVRVSVWGYDVPSGWFFGAGGAFCTNPTTRPPFRWRYK